MVWQKIDDQFGVSKKVIRIPKRRRQQCVGLWTLAGNYAVRALTDGVLEEHELDELDAKPADVAELVRVGLWHAHGHSCETCVPVEAGAIVIHDFLVYNPSRERVESDREAERLRKASQRSRNRSPGGSPGGTPAGSDAVSEQPVPSRPSPDPIDQDTHTSVPVGNRETDGTDEGVSEEFSAHWAGYGVTNFTAIRNAVATALGHPIGVKETGHIIGWIITKAELAGTQPKSMQRYVLAAIRQSWAEVQQYYDEEIAS